MYKINTAKQSKNLLDNSNYPKISIVTPSYNQGQFIEETIRSIIFQGYPNLEYIIIDGSSTDNTVEIIKKYEKYITYWVSEPDRGQSHAINKGFAIATGEIMGWLNSDDLYLPKTFHNVALTFSKHKNKDLISGGCITYDHTTERIIASRPCGTGIAPTMAIMLGQHCYLGQSSTFWRKSVWDSVGSLREDVHNAMDHDFFTRCCHSGFRFQLLSEYLSVFRTHSNQKTHCWENYVAESTILANKYKESPPWNNFIGKVKILLAKKIISFAKHRNIHPRLRLAVKYDETFIRQWLDDLKSQSVDFIVN